MGPPLSAFPMAPQAPTITLAAAGDAVRDLKRSRNSSGTKYSTTRNNEYRLARRSRKLAKDFEGAMEKSVKRKLNSMSGSQHNRKVGLKVAQFIPGKGLEVAGAQTENDPSIYCSLGVKGDKHVDPLDETFSRIKGRQVSMDFSFKLICDNSHILDHDKDTRVTAMNCFRHVNPDSFNYGVTGWHRSVSGSGSYVMVVNVDAPGEFSASQGTPVVSVNFSTGNQTAFGEVILKSTTTSGVYEIDYVNVFNGGSYPGAPPTISFSVGQYTSELVVASASPVMASFIDQGKVTSNRNWHSTLGPDASLIRISPQGEAENETDTSGTWRPATTFGGMASGPGADASNSLMSPYRYPDDMEIMYSRINRQLLENYGWLLNPFKFVGSTFNSNESGDEPSLKSLNTWSNPGPAVMDFNDSGTNLVRSYPAQANQLTEHVTSQLGGLGAGAGYEWHSQMGPGKLSYQFSNDGTNPVCIDICVVGIKKNNPSALALFKNFCDYNYAMHKYANKSPTNVNGFQATNDPSQPTLDLELGKDEWHKNGKMPFMPDQCFKNPQSYLEAADYTHLLGNTGYDSNKIRDILEQGKSNPFKVVKRDQFIVSSGSTRAWNTTLPSINYRPQLYDETQDPIYPFSITQPAGADLDSIIAQYKTTGDEYTYMLCIGACGIPRPVEEVYSASRPTSLNNAGDPVNSTVDAKTIIDRQPSTCNVSVVGTYKEIVYPCYPQDRTTVNFINGRLTEPYFENPPGLLEPHTAEALQSRVNTVDISQLGQVVHTTPTGVVGVGAITTEVGA